MVVIPLNSSRFLKLLTLVFGVVFLNIFLWSPGLLGVEIGGGSVLETASSVTLLFMSFIVLLYGSYVLLLKPPVSRPVKDIKAHEDYVAALHHYRKAKGLKKDISLAQDQLNRIEKKKISLLDVLSQRFDPTELSYRKFHSVIYEVEKLFYLNIRGILNKLSVFDEKSQLYKEYLAYVSGYLGANEEILLKLDKLLLEITRLGSTDYKDVEDMPCMKEIDLLIKQTRFYKQ